MLDTRLFSKPNSWFSSRLVDSGFVLLVATLGVLVIAVQVAQAQTESVLYSFCSQANCADGFHPNDKLVMDAEGNLYGTTLLGGAYNLCIGGCGTVFKLSPSGTETVLHSFGDNAMDGQNPIAELITDAEGNLYGTTYLGGAHGVGTVFELSPTGTETILHSFRKGGRDGHTPYAGLIMDAKGNLYGTTYAGGAYGIGTVFELSPTGTETILHSFAAHKTDGAHPYARLVMDAKGSLYGTTVVGGAYGGGTVFEISAGGTETILHSFAKKGNDGYTPYAGLIMDALGNLYGTTWEGGARGYGTVFEVTPAGTETVLYSFCTQGGPNCMDGMDGGYPSAVIMDAEGNFYGTTYFFSGTVFELSPNGTETILHSFAGSPDGNVPFAGLIMDADGNLYGTTAFGGTSDSNCTGGYQGCGTVFRVIP
jgi:uncharacterized repeat protein (TIGR03803 family)